MTEEMNHSKTSLLTTDDGNEDNSQQPQIYAKNSIDRFGDDLYALLLSYFPLEDHIRYESLSKQFRRTVFGSLRHICIENNFMRRLPKSNISQILATIAIKCTNIETIDCRGISNRYPEHIPEVLNAFRDNCRQLREIYCNLWSNSLQTMRSFGPLVTRIGGIHRLSAREAITECHRLSRLRIDSFQEAFGQNWTLLAKNLHSFELYYYLKTNLENHRLSAFVAQNMCLRSAIFKAQDIYSHFFQQLSRLTQLRELRLTLWLTIGGQNSLSESLRTIGLNCKQLLRLTLEFHKDVYSNDKIVNAFNNHLLDSLKIYRRLKRLDFALYVYLNPEVLEPLTLCHRLTHLTLYLWKMSYELFVNCDKHWPRLQYLSIKTKSMSREYLSHISRLPALKMLIIDVDVSDGISDNHFSDLFTRGSKIKAIEFIVKNNRKIFIIIGLNV